jgi:hypothetical protein
MVTSRASTTEDSSGAIEERLADGIDANFDQRYLIELYSCGDCK